MAWYDKLLGRETKQQDDMLVEALPNISQLTEHEDYGAYHDHYTYSFLDCCTDC